VVGIAAVVLAPAASAQGMKWRGSGGWRPGTAYGRIYDVKTVETVSGEVVKVDRIVPMRGMAYGVNLVVMAILRTRTGGIGNESTVPIMALVKETGTDAQSTTPQSRDP
jgi:hypothetical protein